MGIVSRIIEFELPTWPPIKKGRRTKGGLRLYKRLSLSDPPRAKFAVFSDARLFDKRFWKVWKKFRNFLPPEIIFRGGPLDRNAFESCVVAADVNSCREPTYEEVDSAGFRKRLEDRGYLKGKDLELQLGDIIGYYIEGEEDYFHAGKFQADGRAMSRWSSVDKKVVGPLVEHPVLEILPAYMEHKRALYIPEEIDKGKIRFDVFRRVEEVDRPVSEVREDRPVPEVKEDRRAMTCYELDKDSKMREIVCGGACEQCEKYQRG